MRVLALLPLLAACAPADPEPVAAAPLAALSVPAPVAWDWQLGANDNQIRVPPGVTLLDVDGFETSAGTVARLKAQGVTTVCYIDAGSYEPGRPDSARYPAAIKLQADPDWPGEFFLDIRDVFRPGSALAPILRARLNLCRDKGFAWVEPDNLQNDENVRGGRLTRQDQLDFNGWLADEAHARGLKILQKNGPDQIMQKDRRGRLMVDVFDGILNEACQQYRECGPLAEYVKRGKLALAVEYRKIRCPEYLAPGVSAMQRDRGLKAPEMRGYKRVVCR